MKKIKVLICFFLILILYYFLNNNYNFSIPCMFNKITGGYCPGCGITRMIFSIFRLDFYQAFRYNPLVFLMLLFYIIFKIINLKYNVVFSNKCTYALLIVVIIYGIIRNISYFNYLVPTVVK